MICIDEKECSRKRDRWMDLQRNFCPIGQREFEKFQSDSKSTVVLDKHFEKRRLERSVTQPDLKELLEHGWVIERNKTRERTSVVILGYVGEHYRPLHAVLDITAKGVWVAVTVYDPRSHSWKWNDTFDKRMCFCNKDCEE